MTPTGNLVTLSDGRQVDSASDDWRFECSKRARQVADMMRLDVGHRRDYLAKVDRVDGEEAGKRLRAAFTVAWKAGRSDKKGAASGSA